MPAVAKNIQTWSRTATSNVLANTGFSMDEGMSPSAVNNSVRAIMAALRELHDAFASTQAITLTNNASATNAWAMTAFYTPRDTTNDTDALTAGQVYFGLAPTTVTSTLTLAVNGGSAKPVLCNNFALTSGIITSGDPCIFYYDGTSFHIVLLNKFPRNFVIDGSGNAAFGALGAGQSFTLRGAQAKATVSSVTPFIIQTNDSSNAETCTFTYTGSASSATRIWALEATDQGVGYTPLSLQPNGGDLLRPLSPVALSTNTIGYLGSPLNTQDATYTLVLTDSGKTIYHTSGSAHTWTIPANASVAYPIGTVIRMDNESGGGSVTIAITSDTLRWGSSTGSRTLAANGTAIIQKMTATLWRITGTGIS